MIELPLTSALALYTGILGLFVAVLWIYTEFSVKRPQRHLGRQFLWRCTFCGCSYLDEQAEQLSQCPRCDNYNLAQEASQTPPPPAPPREARPAEQGGGSRRKRPHQRRRGPRRRGR